jgi:hypothetical protein
MGKLLPGETLIYERVDKIVYARYANRPDIPRWVIGGEAPTVLGYKDWEKILELSDTNPTLKKQLDKLIDLYYIIRDNHDKTNS